MRYQCRVLLSVARAACSTATVTRERSLSPLGAAALPIVWKCNPGERRTKTPAGTSNYLADQINEGVRLVHGATSLCRRRLEWSDSRPGHLKSPEDSTYCASAPFPVKQKNCNLGN